MTFNEVMDRALAELGFSAEERKALDTAMRLDMLVKTGGCSTDGQLKEGRDERKAVDEMKKLVVALSRYSPEQLKEIERLVVQSNKDLKPPIVNLKAN